MFEMPRIISVDDHIVEPPNLWWDRLPAAKREAGPHVVRMHGAVERSANGARRFVEGSTAPGAKSVDVWIYDDLVWPMSVGYAHVGPARDSKRKTGDLMTFDEMIPGCYEQGARLADMDTNNTEASLCFPSFPRFCGQTFHERKDHEFAYECLKVYNDWMIDEWCSGAGYGRLIPLTLIPLWDPQLAADEVLRCAGKGSHAIVFPEAMQPLGLPTLYSGAWDPLFRACDETATVVNMHIGSSSTLPTTSVDAPVGVWVALSHENAAHSLVDWLFSGVLARYPNLKAVLSEAQAGWLPFQLQRLDDYWERGTMYEDEADVRATLPVRPSELVRNRIHCCIFNDAAGMAARDVIGMDHLMFEVDYPHSDSTYPLSSQTAQKLIAEGGLNDDEALQFIRGNAIECYDLGRWGIS